MTSADLIPLICSWCKHRRDGVLPSHAVDCPSVSDEPLCSEVDGNLWVGSVEARADKRWVSVVGVLCETNRRWIGSEVAVPACDYLLVDYADREAGLLSHPDLAEAWRRISEGVQRGPVLVHSYQGASRSVAVAAGWMLAHQRREDGRRLRTKHVVERLLRWRPQAIHLWLGYVDELLELEKAMRELDLVEHIVRGKWNIPADCDLREELAARIREDHRSSGDLLAWQEFAERCNL